MRIDSLIDAIIIAVAIFLASLNISDSIENHAQTNIQKAYVQGIMAQPLPKDGIIDTTGDFYLRIWPAQKD